MDLRQIEEQIWHLIEKARNNKDVSSLSELTVIAQDFERLKNEFIKIEERLEAAGTPRQSSERTTTIEITQGAINQSYLTISKPKQLGLIPSDGEFNVKTSVGTSFKTGTTGTMLSTRSTHIGSFYKKAGIKAGDSVIWQEVGDRQYYISKA